MLNYNRILFTLLIFKFSTSFCLSSCENKKCDEIINKCISTEKCNCDENESNIKCQPSKDCFNCMDNLFIECCNCMGICPKSTFNNKPESKLTRLSHVGDFEGHPILFNALTKDEPVEKTAHDYWSIVKFPIKLNTKNSEQSSEKMCTVIFMDDCLSVNKCEKTCESYGSNGYRWFHNGCCQCFGENCINYGMTDARCRKCLGDEFHSDPDEIKVRDDL